MVYHNDSVNNGDSISFSELPSGDDVLFIVNADGYETRSYVYSVSNVGDYNYTFYLPPVRNVDTSKTNSSAVNDPTSDATVTLECSPETIITVRAWNESTYGHWYTIPENGYSISGTTATIDKSMLDRNTTVVQVKYYCDSDTLDYVIHVINQVNNPVDDARVNISYLVDDSYTSVHSILTDGNGDITVPLIPGTHYRVKITKDRYMNEIADFTPSENVRAKTFMLYYIENGSRPPETPSGHITFTGEMTNTTLYVNYTCSYGLLTDCQLYIYETNTSTATENLFYSNTSISSTNWSITNGSIDPVNSYRIVVFFNHTLWISQRMTVVVNPVYTRPTSQGETDNLFELNFKGNPIGWSNFFLWIFMVLGFMTADEDSAGLILILMGGINLVVSMLIGFNTILSIVAGGTVPLLLIVVGIMVLWQTRRKTA